MCVNYRGTALCSLPGKNYCRVLERRLWPIFEPEIQEQQCVFCSGRGTVDQLFTLSCLLSAGPGVGPELAGGIAYCILLARERQRVTGEKDTWNTLLSLLDLILKKQEIMDGWMHGWMVGKHTFLWSLGTTAFNYAWLKSPVTITDPSG